MDGGKANYNAMLTTDQEAIDTIQSLARLRTMRINWESYWQQISELVLPSFSNTFFNTQIIEGQKKDQKRFDGRAEIALYRFTAFLESALIPRGNRWHGLTTSDDSLNARPRVREWFDLATNVLFKNRYAPQANFASQGHEHFQAVGAFGTGCMYTDALQSPQHGRGFRYSQIHMGQVYFDQNHQGLIDRVYRQFRLKARVALQKFGSFATEEMRKLAANPTTQDNMIEVIHCVRPNDEFDPRRKDWRGMSYVSVYVSVTEQKLIMKHGFNTFPYAISRYMTAPGEMYGRSPAMQCFTNIRVLNEQKKTFLKQGQRAADPVILAHDDGVLDGFSLKPGAINTGAINSRGQRLVDVLPSGNVALNEKMMELEKAEIDAAFLTDLIQILTEGPQMTATEVIERAREKGALLSPTFGRQESEFLGPLIERELDVAMSQQLIPPMPPELREAGGEYRVNYDNPMSRAQKSEQSAGIMRVIGWASEIAQQTQDPSSLDWFNVDEIIPDLSFNQGAPFKYINTPDAVQKIRQNRQQQQAIQQVIQAGPTVAAIGKNQQTPQL